MKLRLTPHESTVAGAVQLDSLQSVASVAGRTSLKPHTVVYSLKRLRERGIIIPFLMLNPHRFGFTDYCLFIRIEGAASRVREKMKTVCNRMKCVSYLIELGGHYQWSVSIFGRSIDTVQDFLAELSLSMPGARFSTTFAIRTEWSLLARRYLSSNRTTPKALRRRLVAEGPPIDDVEKSILNYLSKMPSSSVLDAARKIGISEPTARRRIQLLHENGGIIGIPYDLNVSVYNMIPCRVLLQSRYHGVVYYERLYAFALQHPFVSGFVCCTGGWDYEINFDAVSLQDAGEFIQGIYEKFGDFLQSVELLNEIEVYKRHQFEFLLSC